MNHRLRVILSPALAAILAVAGCNTSPQLVRSAERAAAFAALPAETRAEVSKGAIDSGYTLEMVYIALGRPFRVEASADGQECQWTYLNFYPSAAVMNKPLYQTRLQFRPGTAAGRAFAPLTQSPSRMEGFTFGDMNRRRSPARASAGASSEPDIPAVRLDVLFRAGKVSTVLINHEEI